MTKSKTRVRAIHRVALIGGLLGVPAGGVAALQSEAPAKAAAGGRLAGRVVAEGAGVPYAEVEVEAVGVRAAAGRDGRFILRLPAGEHRVHARALGYGAAEARVTVMAGGTSSLEIELRPAALSLDPVVVTGTLRETRVSESPVKVDVVTGGYLRRKSTSNLMETVELVNGLYRQVDCGVCYTDNIRINGMEGPYTAVLIDGMPIMSALASVYGLNGINPSLIERIEVVKGPSSTLYGTEAMGGVVNVITKDSRFAPRVTAEAQGTSWGRWTVDAAAAPSSGEVSALVSGTHTRADRFLDGNGDGFTEVARRQFTSGGVRLTRYALMGRGRLTVDATRFAEDRRGGNLLRLARRTGRRVHILHVSTAEELGLLTDNHAIASVEVDTTLSVRTNASESVFHLRIGPRRPVEVVYGEFGTVPPVPEDKRGQLSGADIEGIVGRAWRTALLGGHDHITAEVLRAVLDGFIPMAQSLERELQTLAAMFQRARKCRGERSAGGADASGRAQSFAEAESAVFLGSFAW